MLYHVATVADWEARTARHYRPAGLAAEGFVHCSAANQLPEVIERYYRGRDDLVLLVIDPAGLTVDVIWEDTTGRGERFPHAYGPIDLPSVATIETLPIDP